MLAQEHYHRGNDTARQSDAPSAVRVVRRSGGNGLEVSDAVSLDTIKELLKVELLYDHNSRLEDRRSQHQ